MSVPLLWVDAFCDRPFGGNPAAVCLLESPAPVAAMQSLAFELGLSETAFVWPVAGGFSLRWFTPVAEVDLCGHATVAAAHALSVWGRLPPDGAVRFHTKSGELRAAVDGSAVEIDLPAETPVSTDPPRVLAARWPVIAAATGRFDLLVEVDNADAVRAAVPDTEDIASLAHRGVAVTARGGPGTGADYVLRYFAPRVGVPEDPVTGSAQCLLGPYWAASLGRARLRVVQLSRRIGTLDVTVAGPRVHVGGNAVTVLSAELGDDVAAALSDGTR